MRGAGKLFLLALFIQAQANHHRLNVSICQGVIKGQAPGKIGHLSVNNWTYPSALTSCPPVQNLINPCICVSYIDILRDKRETAMQSLQV